MPLDEMYVEPLSFPRTAPAATRPVLAHIAEALQASPILVVTAHFGHGKSLTARTLAWRLAAEYLTDAAPDAARPVPVFIKRESVTRCWIMPICPCLMQRRSNSM